MLAELFWKIPTFTDISRLKKVAFLPQLSPDLTLLEMQDDKILKKCFITINDALISTKFDCILKFYHFDFVALN